MINSSQLKLKEADKQWYCVYTIVNHEKKVKSALAEKNIETFLPIVEMKRQWKDRIKRIESPLFPGYLFINISLQNRWEFFNTLNTPGVIKVLGSVTTPTPVSVHQIDSIISIIESRKNLDPYPYLVEGKEVVVVNGPLQGATGKILQRKGEWLLIISVDIIRRSVAVQIDIRDVELA